MDSVELMTITPAVAAHLLEVNHGNRQLNANRVGALAASMRRGEWMTTHQGIAFAANGRLLDGQHRLAAVVQSGVTVQMMVVRGIADEAFLVMDIGLKRSMNDQLGLTSKTVSALLFAARLTYTTSLFSPQQVLAIMGGGFLDVHERLIGSCKINRSTVTVAPIRTAAVVLVMDGHDEDAVFGAYRSAALMDRDCSPVVHAFLKQLAMRSVSVNSKNQLLARGLKVLNPANQNMTSIRLKDDELTSMVAYARTVLRRSVGL